MRIVAAIVALCIAGFLAIVGKRRWDGNQPQRQSDGLTIGVAILILMASTMVAAARPSPYPPVTQFVGDRYGSAQLGAEVARGMGCPTPACARHLYRVKRRPVPVPRPRPGTVAPLSGVVAPLAAKAREIVANCGSTVISGVRHSYIAGTGGRLSLHASGRAVDIKGNPACIMSHLHGWPGGASTDYAAVNHTHISYAPGGPEWGRRFAHYRGGKRHRHHRRKG